MMHYYITCIAYWPLTSLKPGTGMEEFSIPELISLRDLNVLVCRTIALLYNNINLMFYITVVKELITSVLCQSIDNILSGNK